VKSEGKSIIIIGTDVNIIENLSVVVEPVKGVSDFIQCLLGDGISADEVTRMNGMFELFRRGHVLR